jgi:excisionase family DNA binding protein
MSTDEKSGRLLTPAEVATRLNLSVVQVRRMYDELGAFRLGGRLVRFDPERVERWIEERKAEAANKEVTASRT